MGSNLNLGSSLDDVDIIRRVRMLCLKKQFTDAIELAHSIEDPEARKTLVFICTSFEHSIIKSHAA